MAVISTINYLARLELYETEKPYFSNVPLDGVKQSNQAPEPHAGISVYDIRDNVERYTLDNHGFQVFQYDDGIQDKNFDCDEWIQKVYYAKVSEIVKANLGKVDVKIFDHTVRKRQIGLDIEKEALNPARQPSLSAHCDHTFFSGENRIRLHFGAEAPSLLKKRCQIINVWRPLFGPLYDYPLTFCDCNTVDAGKDLVAADLIFPHYVGEQFLVKYNPDHRWHFLSGQNTDEFTFLKCWDNKESVACCVPHTSFQIPNRPPNARLRESVEFRCFVFYES